MLKWKYLSSHLTWFGSFLSFLFAERSCYLNSITFLTSKLVNIMPKLHTVAYHFILIYKHYINIQSKLFVEYSRQLIQVICLQIRTINLFRKFSIIPLWLLTTIITNITWQMIHDVTYANLTGLNASNHVF